jgi:hypothetical protein
VLWYNLTHNAYFATITTVINFQGYAVNSLTISGLTKHQVSLLDTMWQMQEFEQVEAWQQTLSVQDQQQVDLLIRMVLLAATDDVLVEETAQANEYLQKFRL